MPIRDMLTQSGLVLTPSEARIAQVLLTDYPVSGLGTATRLARRAGVSDPTVIRLVTKLGFDGFPAFQSKLLEEVEAGLRSPLMMMEAKRPASRGRSVVEAYIRSAADAVETAAGMTLPQVYARAADLIMDAKGRVLLVGGRFSRLISGMLAAYVAQFRPDVVSLGPLGAERFDTLLDVDKRDVLVVFDYRRYQTDVVRFAEQAAKRGASLVLFTDPWRSPIAEKAKVVIVGPVEVDSPYDSFAPAVVQVEALLAHIVSSRPGTGEARMHELERIRNENAVTLQSVDGRAAPRGGARTRRKSR